MTPKGKVMIILKGTTLILRISNVSDDLSIKKDKIQQNLAKEKTCKINLTNKMGTPTRTRNRIGRVGKEA